MDQSLLAALGRVLGLCPGLPVGLGSAPRSSPRSRLWLGLRGIPSGALWIACLGVLLGALVGADESAAQSLPLRCWTVADGLPQSVANTLFEDSDGFVWIGTAGGLARFDGLRFVETNDANGLPSSRVYAFAEAADGALWAGTDQGLARLEATNRRHSATGWRPVSTGTALDTARGVALLAVDRGSTHDDGTATLLVGTRGEGLWRVLRNDPNDPGDTEDPGDGWTAERVVLSPADSEAEASEETPSSISSLVHFDGSIWVGTEAGLFRIEAPTEATATILTLRLALPDAPWARGAITGLSVGSVEGDEPIAADRYSPTLRVASAAGGFVVTTEGRAQRVVAPTEGRLMTVGVDRSGRSWFGTHHQGLLRIEKRAEDTAAENTAAEDTAADSRSRRIAGPQGLPVDGIRSLLLHSDGGLWIGTYGGGVCRLADESFALYTEEHGLPSDGVLSIAQGSDDALWIGTLEGGAARFEPTTGTFEIYDRSSGLRSPAVVHLAFDSSGTLWAGTLRGGLHRMVDPESPDRRFEPVDLGPEVPGAISIFHVLPDPSGGLWLSTWGDGLLYVAPGSGGLDIGEVTRWGPSDGLLGERVASTHLGPEGLLWIATPEGVQRLDPNRSRTANTDQKPTLESFGDDAPRHARAVLHRTGDDAVWIATDHGLYRYDGERFTTYDRAIGLASNIVFLALFDRDGALWLGSERGLDRLTLDPATGEPTSIRHYGPAQGFLGVETNQNAVLEDRAGRLWFGTRGLARFDPAEATSRPPPPEILLERFETFDGTEISLEESAPQLEAHQNQVVFEWIGLRFQEPEAVRYRYRLLGQSDGWSPLSPSPRAVFPSLAPGRYTFEATATADRSVLHGSTPARAAGGTDDFAWSEPVQLSFVVKPPLWATWWFRTAALSALALLAVVWVRRREETTRRRERELALAVESRTAELRTAKRAAEAASDAKSEFLSNMSHELRTPLTGVVSAAELLRRTALDLSQEQLVGTIETSGRMLLSVINDILDHSRIEALGLQLEERPYVPERSVLEAIDMVRSSAESKGLEVVVEIDDGLPRCVLGDPVRFRQVLLNLLSNAVKFTAEGRIVVRVTCESETARDTCRLQVEVEDTGIGIDASVQQRIFEAFQQGDATMSRAYGGTGLGLSICRRLVTLMGGRLQVDSTPGHGSCFSFDCVVLRAEDALCETTTIPSRFPGARSLAHSAHRAGEAPSITQRAGSIRENPLGEEALSSDPTAETRHAWRSDLRVVLVEDNLTSQMIATAQLDTLGIDPIVVGNGREAIEAVERHDPDLVLMDGQMPVMDGYQASREIRRLHGPAGERPPGAISRPVIIGFTAHATAEAPDRCLDAGMDDYLAKPVSLENLAGRLGYWFPAPPKDKADVDANPDADQDA